MSMSSAIPDSGRPRALAEEHQRIGRRALRQQAAQQRHRGLGKRHPVLLAALHPLARYGPHVGVEVHLAPPGAEHLAGARRREPGLGERTKR
jgi:hypothetical protein